MADVQVKRIDEIDFYKGPNAVAGIRFHPAARALGVTAWGMNVLEIDAGCTGYPEHDHQRDGQEEVYVVLRGSATLEAGDETVELAAGTLARVGPRQRRKLVPGPEGVTLLAIGATPGKAYEPRR
jgi:mannose-6-phosphate isomerase-like protein (cupin superfamily)